MKNYAGRLIKPDLLLLLISVQTSVFLASLPYGAGIRLFTAVVFLMISWYVACENRSGQNETTPRINISYLMLFILIPFIIYLSGPLSFSSHNLVSPDWEKHGLILYRIFEKPLAPEVSFQGDVYRLCYYYGFFILPALIVKLVTAVFAVTDSEIILKLLFFVFSLYFLILFYCLVKEILTSLVQKIFRIRLRKIGLALVVFLVFAGMDYYIHISYHYSLFHKLALGQHAEWYSNLIDLNIQYSSLVTLLAWVPQHLLTALVLIYFILKNLDRPRRLILLNIVLLPFAFSASMWVACGYCLFLFFYSISFVLKDLDRGEWTQYLGKFLLAILTSLPVALFYLSKLYNEGTTLSINYNIPQYLMFVVIEIGIPLVLIYLFSYSLLTGMGKWLLNFSTTVLLLAPLVDMGAANELVMRGTLVFLLLLAFVFAYSVELIREGNNRFRYLLTIILILIGMIPQFLNETVYLIRSNRGTSPGFEQRIRKSDEVLERIITRKK